MNNMTKSSSGISYSNSILLPSKLGWLSKKSPSIFKGWQKRFVVLINKKLYYYTSESCQKKLGVLNFDHITVMIDLPPGKSPVKITLLVLGHSRKFEFRARSAEEASDWVSVLREHLDKSEGSRQSIFRSSVEGKFWKFDSISCKEFYEMATTGDIVLFKSKAIGAALQRCMTWSDYDHVGLILRSEQDEIAFLEATGAEGVTITLFQDFQSILPYFDRIAYRHLEVYRSEEFIDSLKDFIVNSYGKKYRITPTKLLRKKSAAPGREESFFCSELVASAYMKLGLLPNNAHAARYWPGDFSEKSRLELIDAALMPEMKIDFNIPI